MKRITIVVPSFKRENWLREFVSNMRMNLLAPCNNRLREIETRVELHIYVEDVSCNVEELLCLGDRYVKIFFAEQKNKNMNEVRFEIMSASITPDVSHVIFMDDDIYITSPIVGYELADFLSHEIIQNGDTSVSIIPGTTKDFLFYDNEKHLLNSTCFQIYPSQFFSGILTSTWINKDVLFLEGYFEDTLMILLTVVAGADLKIYRGFEDFLHISYFLNLNYSRNYDYNKEHESIINLLNDKYHFDRSGTHINQQKINEAYLSSVRNKTFLTYRFKPLFNDLDPLNGLKIKPLCELKEVSKAVRAGRLNLHTGERI